MANERRKVVHVTTVHQPDDPRILHKECQTLADAGFSVVLIAREGSAAPIQGVRHTPLAVPTGRLQRLLKTSFQALRLAWRENADIYHFHDPELLPGALLFKVAGRRVLYDAHEDLPRQILSKQWIPRPARRVVAMGAGLLEAIAERTLDGVIAATPAIAARFRGAVVVENYPRRESSPNHIREAPAHRERPLQVLYVGGIEAARGAFEMVAAATAVPPGGRMILAGPVRPAQLRSRLENVSGWEQVDAPGWISPADLPDVFLTSRIGLCVLHPLPNYLDSYPTKLFEYMAWGLPVIASDFPLWRRIVEEAGSGILVDPLDANAISAAITYLLNHPDEAEEMGRRGQKAVRAKYQWEDAATRLIKRYKAILNVA